MKKRKILLSMITINLMLFNNGCSLLNTKPNNQITIHSLKKPEIDLNSKSKIITINKFDNDNDNEMTNNLTNKLNNLRIKGEQYFYLRENSKITNNLLKSINFKDNGYFKLEEIKKIKKQLNSETLVLGKLDNLKINDNYFIDKIKECDYNDNCIIKEQQCKISKYSLNLFLRIINLNNGNLLFSDNITKSQSYKTCKNQINSNISKKEIKSKLINEITNNLINKLISTTIESKIIILNNDNFYNLSIDEKKQINNVIKLMKNKKWNEAEFILLNLLSSTNYKSYIVLYNLGILKEIQGKINEAEKLYYLANDLSNNEIIEVNNAIARIKKLQNNNNSNINNFKKNIDIKTILKSFKDNYLKKLEIQKEEIIQEKIKLNNKIFKLKNEQKMFNKKIRNTKIKFEQEKIKLQKQLKNFKDRKILEEKRIQKNRLLKLEKEKLEKEKLEKYKKLEQDKIKKEMLKLSKEKLKLQRLETERLKKEKELKLQQERLEAERLKKEKELKLQQERLEAERLKKEKELKLQQERLEAEKLKKEKELKLQQERLEAERLKKEKELKLQKERLEAERLKKEKELKLQQERIMRELEEERLKNSITDLDGISDLINEIDE